MAAWDTFDELLTLSDPDAHAWADGGDSERASDILASFTERDWQLLTSELAARSARWRACLANTLWPGAGPHAGSLLLAMIDDADEEVAFLAAMTTAFYCGVNAGPEGAFLDAGCRNLDFLRLARATPHLPQQLRRIECAPWFKQQVDLLLDVLDA